MKRVLFAVYALAVGVAMPGIAAAEDKPDSPVSVAGATTVDTAKAKELFDKGAVFVDVRNDKDWDAGRIPGAEHLDNHGGKLTDESLSKALGGSKDKPVVMYCNGHKCLRSSQAAAEAVKWGYKSVYYYRDGYPAWQGAGNPTE